MKLFAVSQNAHCDTEVENTYLRTESEKTFFAHERII
jgi:hypothetical protein